MRRTLTITCLLLCAPVLAQEDTCLLHSAENISDGAANFHLYHPFSRQAVRVSEGDVLEYDIFLAPGNPVPKGGLDATPSDGTTALRDVLVDGAKVTDQSGLTAHGDALLEPAIGKWYARRIPLDALAGKTLNAWDLVFEGDEPGRYTQFIDNVIVRRASGEVVSIHGDGPPPVTEDPGKNGYSKYVLLTTIPRVDVTAANDIPALVEGEIERGRRSLRLTDLHQNLRVLEALAEGEADAGLMSHIGAAREQLDRLSADPALAREVFEAQAQDIADELAHGHPYMEQFTGHLVGHAHIDFQWLWEWPETLQVCRQTFGQALKFMDQYPEFTFSQSSSALYAATEEHHPEIFEGIKQRVEGDRWEIVGGRVCEGDEHMISPESHARQFLYGQRYFRERFGKDAVVGWEPDTFGHTWQMPQILKLGGCDYYYFCRGGHGPTLFWWEAPDGTRVLAFDEATTGSWYNADLSVKQWDELAEFFRKYQSKDTLWVYGVGNHGGGPTLEHIETALDWQSTEGVPSTKFSTATEFFQLLSELDLDDIPVVRTELNTPSSMGFYGTYTTHADIKRWNRDAEAITESAEAVATVASEFGFNYPREAFRNTWEDICWNHHHDTLPGTSIHPSYDLSREMYERAIQSSQSIAGEALAYIASHIDADPGSTVVFNPSGWERDGVIEDSPALPARSIPPFGYKVLTPEDLPAPPSIDVAPDAITLQNTHLRATVDAKTGLVTSLIDLATGEESIEPGGSAARFEIHWEDGERPGAWVINSITELTRLDGADCQVQPLPSEPNSAGVRVTRSFRDSTIVQNISLAAGMPYLDCEAHVEWNETCQGDGRNPFLKVAFDLNLIDSVATYDIPFGAIERPADGAEVPALKWADLTEYESVPAGGATRAPKQVDLSGHFDADIFSSAGAPSDGDFDGQGRALPSEMLPGRETISEGVPFLLPDVSIGEPNAVSADGRRVEVPRDRYPVLHVLGSSATGDSSGALQLHYADGTDEMQTLAFTDWCVEPRHGESVAIESAFRYEATGQADPACRLFVQSLPVNADEPLIRITLPADARMKIVAITLGGGRVPMRRGKGLRGASLLNDSKHGHSADGSTLRLSLLRTSVDPDPEADVGSHVIRYALYPHVGDWRDARTVRLAEGYNHPLLARAVPADTDRSLPATYSFLQIKPASAVVTGLKRAEDDDDVVVRLYEASGQPARVTVTARQGPRAASSVNFMEDPLADLPTRGRSVRFPLRPSEIRTIKLRMKPPTDE